MANLNEISFWETGIKQIERSDLWDAGVGGNGVANLQAKQLANRTSYLKGRIEEIRNRQNYFLEYTNLTLGNNSNINAKGTAYVLDYPLSDWDYSTLNDGVTRNYMVELVCHVGVGFTYSTNASVSMVLHTTTAGPNYVELARCASFQPGVTIMCRKKIQLGPGVKIKAFFSAGNVGANVPVNNASFHIEEII